MDVDIDKMSTDELVALNHRIVERLKFMETMQAHESMMTFNLGARVCFDTNEGQQLGTLVKFNRKTVTVMTDGGQRWNISPQILSKVKDAKPVQEFIVNNEKQLE